jgi:hypothetical protein
MLRCRLLGHRYRFHAEERVMVWVCQRGCGSSDRKVYASAEQATRYARALDRDDRSELGRRAPLLGLLPLRIIHSLRRRGA